MKKLRTINETIIAGIGWLGATWAGMALKTHHDFAYWILMMTSWWLILTALRLKNNQNWDLDADKKIFRDGKQINPELPHDN